MAYVILTYPSHKKNEKKKKSLNVSMYFNDFFAIILNDNMTF